jgi:predicted ABC-class ATPase
MVEMDLPHGGRVRGMGVKEGVTLIVGGGYHGKSTLLSAIERGVYDHIRGDGREYVVTRDDAVKVRAEDGRSVVGTDISMFINNLPGRRDTVFFSTENASGSTSQAANLVEAAECGSRTLLIDEDTCATNFMVRDSLMEKVVSRDKEPITPFMERARYLYEKCGISTILVAGSSGSYFHIADTVIQMDEYIPVDITKKAKETAEKYPDTRPEILPDPVISSQKRIPLVNRQLRSDERLRVKSFGTDTISIDRMAVDIRYLEQLVDQEQTATLSLMLLLLEKELFDGKRTVCELADMLIDMVRSKGFSAIVKGSYISQDLAMVRKHEICAMINRYRGLQVKAPAKM